jgi:hypothetical protein
MSKRFLPFFGPVSSVCMGIPGISPENEPPSCQAGEFSGRMDEQYCLELAPSQGVIVKKSGNNADGNPAAMD